MIIAPATTTRTIATPLGDMIAAASDRGLHVLEFLGAKHADAHLDAAAKAAHTEPLFTPAAPLDDAGTILDTLTRTLAAIFDRNPEPLANQLETQPAIPLAPHGTDFQRRVWRALLDIPRGQTTTYGRLAQHLGTPTATRAVANANARNPIAILIPCHRVIGQEGSLTGYAAGLDRKHALLQLEQLDDCLFASSAALSPPPESRVDSE